MTDEQIIQVARDMNALVTHYGITSAKSEWLITFAHRIAELEREACAKVCDDVCDETDGWGRHFAEQIRERK